jgi:hypothetical protein
MLDVPSAVWVEIAMDFIEGFSASTTSQSS